MDPQIGGKTVTRRLTDAELAEYQPLFDNTKKLRALLAQLQDLTLQIISSRQAAPSSRKARQTGAARSGNVGQARITCGRPSSQTPFAQASPKGEYVSQVRALSPPCGEGLANGFANSSLIFGLDGLGEGLDLHKVFTSPAPGLHMPSVS